MISDDGSGFLAPQDDPAVTTCLPMTERFKGTSDLPHLENSGKLRRTDSPMLTIQQSITYVLFKKKKKRG